MTAQVLAAREGRPSVAGLQRSLELARDTNRNLRTVLRTRRAEEVALLRQIRGAGDWLAEPVHAEQTFNVVRTGEALSAAASRRLGQLGEVL